ncbi:jg20618 [Pararge aegeria aegeria]|uniref:Jg20618 protein n=1 Tax=Pararge aegeria aegeria TaxID=348720 RepID=A0A8S4R6D8_9NEOP|nr:jg20618 [Pararge aegeria aegeria]
MNVPFYQLTSAQSGGYGRILTFREALRPTVEGCRLLQMNVPLLYTDFSCMAEIKSSDAAVTICMIAKLCQQIGLSRCPRVPSVRKGILERQLQKLLANE